MTDLQILIQGLLLILSGLVGARSNHLFERPKRKMAVLEKQIVALRDVEGCADLARLLMGERQLAQESPANVDVGEHRVRSRTRSTEHADGRHRPIMDHPVHDPM